MQYKLQWWIGYQLGAYCVIYTFVSPHNDGNKRILYSSYWDLKSYFTDVAKEIVRKVMQDMTDTYEYKECISIIMWRKHYHLARDKT